MLNLTWGIDVLFEKLTVETEVWIWEKNPFHNASGGGDFCKACLFLNIFSIDPHVYALIIGFY